MIGCNSKGNTFGVKLIMQLGNGCCETMMLHLSEKLINLGSFSERLPLLLEDSEHLLKGVEELAEGKCTLALVMKVDLTQLALEI